jgi:hypothetical protein
VKKNTDVVVSAMIATLTDFESNAIVATFQKLLLIQS